MATKPWDAPVTGNMFGGAAPTPVYTPTPYGGYGPGAAEIEDAMRSGTYYAPEGSPNPLGPGSNINEPVSTSGPDWLGKGMEALTKALAYKSGAASSPTSSSRRPQAANATVVGGGRGYTIFMPGQTTKTTQSSGSPGVISSIANIAAPIAAVIPGGQVAAGLITGAGRAASMFGA